MFDKYEVEKSHNGGCWLLRMFKPYHLLPCLQGCILKEIHQSLWRKDICLHTSCHTIR